jgi:hypothetical protein
MGDHGSEGKMETTTPGHDKKATTPVEIQSLWLGPRFSKMERLAVTSFLRQGHTYKLYVYDEVLNVPEGTSIEDAGKVLPRARVFLDSEQRHYSTFSNIFRYKLLLERGGLWVDTDIVCLRPFRFASEYVLGYEEYEHEPPRVASCVIGAPAASPLMQICYETSVRKNPADLRWGEVGPALLHDVAMRLGLASVILPYWTFCPIPHWRWQDVICPRVSRQLRVLGGLARRPHAVHLWNEMWRRAGTDKDLRYHRLCLYETLVRRWRVATPA